MPTPSLVVSIHDVSPLPREPVTPILAAPPSVGIPRVSILVVPDHHHRASITADPHFASWLRDQVAAGHEPVLHGYFHQRERLPGESTHTRFFTRHYTAGEGEFFDIPYQRARALMARGREELTQVAGTPPAGFIAPAWLLSHDAESAARSLHFSYTTRLRSLLNLQSSRLHPSQSLCWSIRSPWRRATSLAWNPLLFRSLRNNPPLRLSVHPPHLSPPHIWRQILLLSTQALEHRTPATYRSYCE